MGDLKTEDTSYPATLDTRTLIADSTDDVVAAHVNGLASAIIALETELGVNPAGSVTDIVTRLAVNLHDDGGVLRGTSFPVSPPLKLHLFWRTDLKQLYMYDTSIAQYQRVDATNVHANLAALDADDHTQYVHNTTARTITAQHTFNPGSALPPFILHANAQGQKVIGLDAETVDGKNPGSASGIATLNGSSLVVEDPANATATKTAGKICKWGTSEAFECGALAASGQITSTVATGTAPFSIASTTKVSNLNADKLQGYRPCLYATSSTATTETTTIDLGTVTTGDIFIMNVNITVDAGSTPANYISTSLEKASGTATVWDGYALNSIHGIQKVSATVFIGDATGVFTVTSGGTLIMKSVITNTGGVGNGYRQVINVSFLKYT